MNIGIAGYGVVGKALCGGFEDKAAMHISDPLYSPEQSERFKNSLEEVWWACDFIFVTVPTPQNLSADQQGGPFDPSIVDQVVSTVATLAQTENPEDKNKVLVLMSTTLPSKVGEYLERHPQLNLIVLPEFLTQRNALQDFLNPTFRIIGGEPKHAHAVQELFEQYSTCTPCKVGYCDAIGAAFIKYMTNSFMAVKVSFLNQFYDLFRQSNSRTTWTELSDLLHHDARIGNSHKNIPGYDGDRGWGGKCLPKDVNAIMRDAREQGCPLSLLEEAWEYNLRIRSKIDWK